MYKDKNGEVLFKNDIVVDTYDRLWFVEGFLPSADVDKVKAKCRNGCSYTTWLVNTLEGVTHK